MSALDEVVFWLGSVIGVVPWLVLFLAQWKRSIIPCSFLDDAFGKLDNPPGLRGRLKFVLFPGCLCLYMNLVLWLTTLPANVHWNTFPKFCVVPRTFKGFFGIYQSGFHHGSFMHFAGNNFGVWTLGPLMVSYNRRTFVSSLFFINGLGGFLLWLAGPDDHCIVGFSGIVYGWFGCLTLALFAECPPKWYRIVLLVIVGIYLGPDFYTEVVSGDDEEGTSWHGHAYGFFAGLFYAYLRFRRKWFLLEGLEDGIRPIGHPDPSICQALRRLALALIEGVRDGCADIGNICRCKSHRVAFVDEEEDASLQRTSIPRPATGQQPAGRSTPAASSVGRFFQDPRRDGADCAPRI